MPHGCCYFWNSGLITLHVVSDGFIALAYYSIPITLIYFVRRRRDVAFHWIFLCFAAFILACGTTHMMEILNIWHPIYWLSGIIKAITALISIITAILLMRLVPKALALPSPEQLRRSNEALQHEIRERAAATERVLALNAELLAQTAKLEEANKEMEAFGYSVSHDLRAPLRHIHGYVDLLREDDETDETERQRYMTVIAESARRMGNLIDSLLAFSRMGRMALQPVATDMTAVVAECRQELAPDLEGRDIAWTVGPLPTVNVDRGLFRQVWLNLLGNAIKYTKYRDHATIEVGATETPGEHQFFVKDNGAGFDMEHARKLFGIFQRLHLKEEFDGTGIGLANVRRIVTRHGGRTWAQAEIDKGATFFFTLPKP